MTKTRSPLSAEEVRNLRFAQLVALVDEPNMPSGGRRTIQRILEVTPLTPRDRILEIGSTTGFSSIEFGSWFPGEVVGVDVDETAIRVAATKATAAQLENVRFVHADALSLPFPDNSFSIVFCSNATAFITQREAAVAEYYRVLRPRGILACAPIYYVAEPPAALRTGVEKAIGSTLPPVGRRYWEDLFAHERATLVFDETYEYIPQSPDAIDAYVRYVFDRGALSDLYDTDALDALRERLSHFFTIFNENLRYTRYSILLYRLDHPNPEPILFATRLARSE